MKDVSRYLMILFATGSILWIIYGVLHTDASNLFGGVETIRRKLDILKKHCKSVGRGYDSMLKTK
jgi:uncharacterized protein with PQ loop repeat